MKTKIKKLIKGLPVVHKSLLFAYDLLLAIRGISLNFDSIREFSAKQKGFVQLGSANYQLYSNVFPRLLERYSGDAGILVLDVGGSDGWFAKIIFRFCGPQAKVISFEPLRSMAEKLSQLSSCYSNYHFEGLALGSTGGETEIIEYGTSGLSSMKTLSKEYGYSNHYDTRVVDRYTIKVVTVDEYLKSHDINDHLVLKIDTQGFEYEVLLGAKEALSSGQIIAVIIEVMTIEKYAGAKLYNELFEFLHSYGFKVFDLGQSYYEADGSLSEIDCVFIKS